MRPIRGLLAVAVLAAACAACAGTHSTPSAAQPPMQSSGSIRSAVSAAERGGGVRVLQLKAARAVSISLSVDDPAWFLKHRLGAIVEATRPYDAARIRIVDSGGAHVFDWSKWAGGGSLAVRPDLEGCSPVAALGWSAAPACLAA
jgi:hypothetical protein